jgi:hypothetical protein
MIEKIIVPGHFAKLGTDNSYWLGMDIWAKGIAVFAPLV